jgi:hypothetical protein
MKTLSVWFKNRNFTLNLLYSKLRDGCNASLIKENVYDKNNILAVYKMPTGDVLGAFTAIGFRKVSRGWLTDKEQFQFSLTKNVTLGQNWGIADEWSNAVLVWGHFALYPTCSLYFNADWPSIYSGDSSPYDIEVF